MTEFKWRSFICDISSIGRASDFQSDGCEFETRMSLHMDRRIPQYKLVLLIHEPPSGA